jgi:ribosomal protein S27E
VKIRFEIDDDLIRGSECAICATAALTVVHLTDYADYVICEVCGSSFVMDEGGERVLYGKVSDQYPQTEKAVLKVWTDLEAVEQLASTERKEESLPPSMFSLVEEDYPEKAAAGDGESSEAAQEEEDWVDLSRLNALDELYPSGLTAATSDKEPDSAAVKQEEIQTAEQPMQDPQLVSEVVEIPPQDWYRVVITGDRVYFPVKACAHCMTEPATHKYSVVGSLPVSVETASRRRASFRLPLCEECHSKLNERSNAQKSAQLQVHLTSALVALGLLILTLGLEIVDLSGNISLELLILAAIGGLGYILPLTLLLPRTKRVGLLLETQMVRTTLQIQPPEEEVPNTSFDFRNRDYAELFLNANKDAATGKAEVIEIQAEPADKGG